MTEISLRAYVGEHTPRVLIVDDEPINLKVLAAHLVRWGCAVHAVPGGQEAIDAVGMFEPDLILLDIMMPGLSGYDVCRILQSNPATKHIPIIFLTAVAGEQPMLRGLAAGARDYITKPFVSADLAARIGAQLRQRLAGGDGASEDRRVAG